MWNSAGSADGTQDAARAKKSRTILRFLERFYSGLSWGLRFGYQVFYKVCFSKGRRTLGFGLIMPGFREKCPVVEGFGPCKSYIELCMECH